MSEISLISDSVPNNNCERYFEVTNRKTGFELEINLSTNNYQESINEWVLKNFRLIFSMSHKIFLAISKSL